MMSTPTPDTCPLCQGKMFPVLDPVHDAAPSGPVSADPPFRLACTACPPVEAPSLATR